MKNYDTEHPSLAVRFTPDQLAKITVVMQTYGFRRKAQAVRFIVDHFIA